MAKIFGEFPTGRPRLRVVKVEFSGARPCLVLFPHTPRQPRIGRRHWLGIVIGHGSTPSTSQCNAHAVVPFQPRETERGRESTRAGATRGLTPHAPIHPSTSSRVSLVLSDTRGPAWKILTVMRVHGQQCVYGIYRGVHVLGTMHCYNTNDACVCSIETHPYNICVVKNK